VGHSADFTLSVLPLPPVVAGTSKPWLRQAIEDANFFVQAIVFIVTITYSQLFSHFRGSLRPFRGERDMLCLAAR
jgi:hypothetical protein